MPKITVHGGANAPGLTPVPARERVDYSTLLKAELVALADERGVDSSGTKAELTERLEADDELAASG